MMPDQQLQQYAAMHKDDPYIFPMAFAESNARKEARAAQQAQAMGQQQPKVVDQDLMEMGQPPMPPQGMMPPQGGPQGMPPQGGPQMAQQQQLPENQGIGALPAPNMQHMADGGIAGYADGGEFNYSGGSDGPLMNMAGGGEPVMRMAGGGVAHFADMGLVQGQLAQKYQKEIQELTTGARVQFSPDVEAYAQQVSAQENAANQKAQQAYLERERAQMLRSPYTQTPAATTTVMPTLNKATMPAAGYTRTDPRAAASMPSIAEQMADTTGAAPVPDTDKRQPAPPSMRGPSAPPSAAAPEQSAAQRYAAMQKDMGLGDTQKIDAERMAYADSLRNVAADEKAAFERDMATRGKYGEAKETRLNAREAGLGKEKEQMTGLALLEAGLGIMSTPGNLAQAIGKGAKEGLKSYGEGLAKLKLAQERIDDSRDSIEEFRRNEANMTATERRKFESQIGRTEAEIKKLAVDAAKDMYGYKRDDAKAVFSADTQERLTEKEIQGRKDVAAMQERGANARALLPTGEMRAALLLGSGKTDQEKYESGLIKYKELLGDKQGTQMLKLFLEENGRREKVGQDPISLENFRRTTAAFFAPPAPVDTGRPTRP
jgi:hypothetical protein